MNLYAHCLTKEIHVGKLEITLTREKFFHSNIYYYQIFKKRELKLRNIIIWNFGHGFLKQHFYEFQIGT